MYFHPLFAANLFSFSNLISVEEEMCSLILPRSSYEVSWREVRMNEMSLKKNQLTRPLREFFCSLKLSSLILFLRASKSGLLPCEKSNDGCCCREERLIPTSFGIFCRVFFPKFSGILCWVLDMCG